MLKNTPLDIFPVPFLDDTHECNECSGKEQSHFPMGKHQITIPIFIPHLGCTHRCIFCDQWSTTGVVTIPGPEIIDEIVLKYLPQARKTVDRIELAFFGGSFTAIPRHIQESLLSRARHHLEVKNIQGIRCSTRPDCISDDILAFLKDFGVTTVEIGVQSFDETVLSAANRGHSSDDAITAARCIQKNGVNLVIQLMPGLPGETRESALRSSRLAAELGPAAVRIYPAVVLKGTFMERLFLKGDITPMSLEHAVDLCADLYQIFSSRNIPVIRMGLHPLSAEQAGRIAAGPYHPSFGFLVKSRVRRKTMESCLARCLADGRPTPSGNIRMIIPDIYTEEFIGCKKDNIRYLEKHFNLKGIRYSVGPVPDLQIIV